MKTTKRDFTRFVGALMVAATGAPALVGSASVSARTTRAPGSPGIRRGSYLIRNGAVIAVDRAKGVLPRADVLVRDGVIEKVGRGLRAPGDAEIIDATDMIESLKGRALLDGFRGAPPADRKALIELVLRISALVEALPEMTVLDLNPVMVLEPGAGAVVVDGRMLLRAEG